MYKSTCALTLMTQRKTIAIPVHQHWRRYSSAQAPDINMATRQQMYKSTCVCISMAQCKTVATPVHRHWSQHSSTQSNRHLHGSRCVKQLVCSHWWPSARLQQLQCISTGATMVAWPHLYKATCVLTLMAQRETAATPVHQQWSYHISAPIHQNDHGNIATYV